MQTRKISPLDREVRSFIEELDRANRELYPNGPNYLESPEAMAKNSTMIGIFFKDELIAMGGLKWQEGFAEVKRLFVIPEQRGKKLGARVMEELEKVAMSNQVLTLRLETGVHQKSAVKLYQQLGYKKVPAFGDYTENPLSLFFEKNL